jgi:translation initiation factor IF-2
VGDSFEVVKTEKDARTVAGHRAEEKRQAALGHTGRRTAADLFAQAEATERKSLNVIIKSDVQGSLEALKQALGAISIDGTELRILHAAAGDVSESDVMLAAANGALLLGFNVRVDARARQAAESHGVKAEIYDVIYGLLDRVSAAMSGLVAPETREVKQGTVEVRQVFAISKVGRIAGCHVTDGKVGRAHTVRVMRDGHVVWEGRVRTLKRFKEDVREVQSGYDCGVGLDGFDAFQEGDVLESYTREEVKV